MKLLKKKKKKKTFVFVGPRRDRSFSRWGFDHGKTRLKRLLGYKRGLKACSLASTNDTRHVTWCEFIPANWLGTALFYITLLQSSEQPECLVGVGGWGGLITQWYSNMAVALKDGELSFLSSPAAFTRKMPQFEVPLYLLEMNMYELAGPIVFSVCVCIAVIIVSVGCLGSRARCRRFRPSPGLRYGTFWALSCSLL